MPETKNISKRSGKFMVIEKILTFLKWRRTVTYDNHFFDESWFENWKLLKHVLYRLLQVNPGWRSILDFGCGPGVMIDYMNSLGYDYFGCDNSEEARQLYFNRFGNSKDRYFHSLDACTDHDFDLFLAFDVLEHMRDEDIAHVLQKTIKIPEFMVNISRSRTVPGHINIKKDRQWIEFFNRHGLSFDEATTAICRSGYLEIQPTGPDLWHRNLFVFSRNNLRISR